MMLDVLELEAAGMEAGTRSRIRCPKCLGGISGELSLSLFKDHSGAIAWKCFRAKCDFAGNPKGVTGEATKKAAAKYYTEPYTQVYRDDMQGAWLYNRYRISMAGIYWNPTDGRYVLQVQGPQGQLRGHQAYSFETGANKCITYRERVEEPWLHYASTAGGCTHAVIVEDWFSAQKVAGAGALGIALLGTVLNRERVDEIKQACRGMETILALDLDAYPKAIKYCLEYGDDFTPSLKVWRLRQDLKYVSVDRIKRELNGGTGDFTSSNASGS